MEKRNVRSFRNLNDGAAVVAALIKRFQLPSKPGGGHSNNGIGLEVIARLTVEDGNANDRLFKVVELIRPRLLDAEPQ